MGRAKKKPDYDPEKILNELLDNVVAAYEQLEQIQRTGNQLAYGALKELSDAVEMKPSKVKKLLITAGERDNREIYGNDASRLVLSMYKNGKKISEIMETTGLKRSAVFGYLPYSKTVYKASELSTDAERIKLFRQRQQRCKEFSLDLLSMSDDEIRDYLWRTLEFLQGCIFYTAGRGGKKGLRYKYSIRGGEMFIDRREKSITKATVMLAFDNTRKLQQQEGCVSGPKKIGTFGASYLYPIFLRLGVCTAVREGE